MVVSDLYKKPATTTRESLNGFFAEKNKHVS
jgi:hypothetical protein